MNEPSNMYFGFLEYLIFGLFIVAIFLWFVIRSFILFCERFFKTTIKYHSIRFGDINKIYINHRLFGIHIDSIDFLSSFSIFALKLPIISINRIQIKLNYVESRKETSNKQMKDLQKKLHFLKYLNIRIHKIEIEYQNIHLQIQRLTLQPERNPSATCGFDMLINCEYVGLSCNGNVDSNTFSTKLLKSTWDTIEMRTDFSQCFFMMTNNWSIELNAKIFDYFNFKENKSSSKNRISNFHYTNSNSPTISESTNSNSLFNKFDKFIEYLQNPLWNLSIHNIDITFISTDNICYNYVLNYASFLLHNSSSSSNLTRHSYIFNYRLNSNTSLLFQGLSYITVYPISIDISSQLNEFHVDICESTIQNLYSLFSLKSASTSETSWKYDRQIHLSFQVLNPSIYLKLKNIQLWYTLHGNFLKINYHLDRNSEIRSAIELKYFLIYTSDEKNTDCQKLIDKLNIEHLWNCLLYIPNWNLTMTYSKSINISSDFSGIRLQSNSSLIFLIKYLQKLPILTKKQERESNRPIEIAFRIKSLNITICDTVPIYLYLTISTIRVSQAHSEIKKLFVFMDTHSNNRIPLASLTNGQKLLSIRRLNINYSPVNSVISIIIPNNVTIIWTTKVHLFIYRYILSLKPNTNEIQTQRNETKSSIWNSIQLEIQQSTNISLQLSNDCRIQLEIHQFSSLLNSNRSVDHELQLRMQCSQLFINCQNQCIFTVHNILFQRLYQSDVLTTERLLLRKTLQKLEMVNNRASLVEINSFSIRFPFESTFNEVVEKLVNIRKWLKRLHRTNADMSTDFLQRIPQHTISDDVWTDLSIKINDFELTIVDDLFEVKLFQNYCLMGDEYHEQLLRKKELHRRFAEYERISKPMNRVALENALIEANSQVYIKRSRITNYNEDGQRITRNLIRWYLRKVDLIALADRSMTGKENILKMIHKIDNETPEIPIDTTDLCTIWCRYVMLKCDEWSIHFRDFRQPLWQMQQFHLWGYICAAETTPISLDSIRTPWVEIGEPYSPSRVQVQRLLSPLKFYHDINSDIGSFLISYGPAWENTMAQVNLCLNNITPRTVDPSPLLPWWDKIRLYLHGRWSFAANKMSWLYHVDLNPYNDTEEMEWVWDTVYVDWTDRKFLIQAASLSIKLRTSSKYDDCCLLYLPNVDTRISLEWLCNGNSYNHHAVRLYRRDAVLSWKKRQAHDSYCLYRSNHLNITAKFECKYVCDGGLPPTLSIYASTLRFCERVKNTMMSITRPTRRGRLFLAQGETVVPPRKPLLSRHYQIVEIQLILPQFCVKYLTSFARQTGAQIECELFNFVTQQELNLVDYHDGLARRPKIVWKPKKMNVNLQRAQMWLLRDANEDKDNNETATANKSDHQQESQRTFFLSLDSLIYVRSSLLTQNKSTHYVSIDALKAVWNLMNRRTLFLVYERYRRNNILRSNLSNPFAKELEHLQQDKTQLPSSEQTPADDILMKTLINSDEPNSNQTSTAPSFNSTTSQSSTLASFLDQLIDESQYKSSVDLNPAADTSVSLIGLRQCNKDDVEEHVLRIELSNSQIALRGTESPGYVILSAKKALIDQYRHTPIWRDQQLCDKTSWHGDLQDMQYDATTVSTSTTNNTTINISSSTATWDDHDIIWIPSHNIREENSLLGEPSRTVIGTLTTNDSYGGQQLQCIVPKSNATLSYVFYTEQRQQEEETDTNIVIPPYTKPSLNESNPIGESDRLLVDSFTFIHNDIALSTNSSQYRTIMDIVNNLLLYVEPKEEGSNSKLKKLRLQIQLASNLPVLRRSIQELLERVRSALAELRRFEREIYYLSRTNSNLASYSYSSDEEDANEQNHSLSSSSNEYENLQTSYTSVKSELNRLAEKLGMMCALYKDMQLAKLIKMRIAATNDKTARLERRYELHGGSITWFIKHDDGQISNARFLLKNILYTKRYFENGTNEHSISIGQAQVDSLLPDDRYQTILTSNCQQQQTMIRVYCKEGEPVGGIAVKEHLEINVAPLVIQMTLRFSQMLWAFLFPNKAQSNQDIQQTNNNNRLIKPSLKRTPQTLSKRRARSTEGDEELLAGRSLFYFSINDLDAMEKRAKNTLTFQYIKIPEVSLIVSYKIRGTKENKIGDLENALISFPTLEYRNLTCSWHDLLLTIKSDVKTVLLSQAIRQNINLRLPFIGKTTRAQNQQLLTTTTITRDTSTNNSHVLNSDTMNNSDLSNTDKQDEEEQKHKMKLMLGTKITKDLLTQFKRRKDS